MMIGLFFISSLLLAGVLGYNIGCRQTEHWYRVHGVK